METPVTPSDTFQAYRYLPDADGEGKALGECLGISGEL